MSAYERFLKYVRINTESAEGTGTSPSTACQWDLANVLLDELKELGLEDVKVSEFGVITAYLPATPGCEDAPALGLLAHMDTAPAFSGNGVEPILHENYNGEDIVLPKEGRVLRVADFPVLTNLKGRTLITADGSTLLGADDKAGIAEILTAAEILMTRRMTHATLKIGFTPDEEIGRGADKFDVQGFGADYAYTADGGAIGEIEYENFNAAGAKVEFKGLNIHPGSAKDKMVNSQYIAMEFQSLLPAAQKPEYTEGYEGFIHLTDMEGEVEKSVLRYIIRDHDMAKFEEKKSAMEVVADFINRKYGAGTCQLTIRDSYFNMKQHIEPVMYIIDRAKAAMKAVGMEPKEMPIRGGTDGARLSYMGLPCPNLCTGGENFHGRFEYIPVEDMEQIVKLLVEILTSVN